MTTPESLTAEERARLEWEMSDEDDAPDGPSTELVTKLLRIHDRLEAENGELERKLMDSYDENRTLRARNRELEPL